MDASACRVIMLRRGCGGLKHINVKSLRVEEAVRKSIEIERTSHDEMHVHILVSPCSVDVRSVPLDGIGIFLTMVMSRLFNWGHGCAGQQWIVAKFLDKVQGLDSWWLCVVRMLPILSCS